MHTSLRLWPEVSWNMGLGLLPDQLGAGREFFFFSNPALLKKNGLEQRAPAHLRLKGRAAPRRKRRTHYKTITTSQPLEITRGGITVGDRCGSG